MRILILALILVALPFVAAAQSPCPEQPSEIVAQGTAIRVCFPEPTDRMDLEVGGNVVSIEGPFGVGPYPDLINIETCANTTLRARGANAAGVSEWGSNVGGIFRPCFAPIILPGS